MPFPSVRMRRVVHRGVHWFAGDDLETAQVSVVPTEKAVKQLLALVGEFAR